MASFKGRDAVILFGLSDPPTDPVGKHWDASLDMNEVTADATTNDSGGSEEHEIIRDNGQLTFKVLTDEADAGQNNLRDAYETKVKGYVIYRPRGTSTGLRQYKCRCTVTLKRGTPRDGLATTDVTLKKDGAWTISNQ